MSEYNITYRGHLVTDGKVEYNVFDSTKYFIKYLEDVVKFESMMDANGRIHTIKLADFQESAWVEVSKDEFLLLSESQNKKDSSYKRAILDFTRIERNEQVRQQGKLTCIWIDSYGGGAWFSPELGRYPSRQDLADIKELSSVII